MRSIEQKYFHHLVKALFNQNQAFFNCLPYIESTIHFDVRNRLVKILVETITYFLRISLGSKSFS